MIQVITKIQVYFINIICKREYKLNFRVKQFDNITILLILGAPYCRGNGSSRLFLSENSTENANVDDKKQSQEGNNTGNKNTRSNNHAIRKLTGSFENKLNEIEPSITNKSSRNASIDSAEDSGDWDDLEIPRLMPELTAIDEHLNEHRIQFPVIMISYKINLNLKYSKYIL